MTDRTAALDGFVIECWYAYPPSLAVQCTRCGWRNEPDDLPSLRDADLVSSDADTAVSLRTAAKLAEAHSAACPGAAGMEET